jgi:phospholipid/cholesterol/gamma-HCH transport system substrate-binding protein
MQRQTPLEISVGAFVTVGALALLYLSVTLGGLRVGGSKRYPVIARFSNVGSLKVGDPVRVAGVLIGEVQGISLVDYAAEAQLLVDNSLKLPEDTIASVLSAGLLGDAYVSLSPGASEKDLPAMGRIQQTEPAVSLTELLGKYAFGNPVADDKAKGDAPPGTKPESHENSGAVPAGTAAKPSPFSDPLQ